MWLRDASNVAGEGGSAVPEHVHPGAEEAFEVTAAPEAGWSWFADPRAVHRDGVTYFGYVKPNGDIVVRSYTHATETLSAGTVLNAGLDGNDHANPSILIRASDGRIMVFYSAHNDSTMRLRISTNPEDVSSFSSEVSLDAQLGGSEYTYPSPVQLDDGTIWLFYRRDVTLTTSRWAFSTSTDGGVTWASETILIDQASPARRPYLKVAGGGPRIDVALSDGHPTTNDDVSIYHLYFEDGDWRRTDGTAIAGGFPFDRDDLTRVHDGTAGDTSWIWDVALDPLTGLPIVAYATFPSTSDHRYRYARWSGTSWQTHEVAAAGGHIYSDSTQPHYSGGIVLDHDRPSVVYASQQVGSGWEMFRHHTTDGGVTWATEQLTSVGSKVSIRPVVVRNSAPDLRALWLTGTYTLYTDWDTGTSASRAADAATLPAQRADATIEDPDADVTVTHGLPRAPEHGELQVTPRDDSDGWLDGAASTKFAVADLGATTFRIAVDTAPGSGKHATFDWLWVPADLAVPPPSAAYEDEVDADSPFAWWRLEETAGLAAADEGATHDGTIAGTPDLDVAGAAGTGSAIEFNGAGQRIDVGTLGSFGSAMSSGITVEFLVKFTGTSLGCIGGTLNTGTNMALVVNTNATGQFGGTAAAGRIVFTSRAQTGGASTHRARATARDDLNDGQWHHVVATLASLTSSWNIYVDGVLDNGAEDNGGSSNTSANFGFSFTWGARNLRGTFDQQFAGDLDEPSLYTSVLSAARVAAHAAAADL